MPAPTVRTDEEIAAALKDAPSVGSAAFRLKVSRTWLRARCVADDTLRPLFYAVSDRGRSKVHEGRERLEWSEADSA